jgi:hypothetical protein
MWLLASMFVRGLRARAETPTLQFGQVQSPHQRPVLTPVPLVVHQQSQPLQEAEFPSGRILLLCLQSIRHAV